MLCSAQMNDNTHLTVSVIALLTLSFWFLQDANQQHCQNEVQGNIFFLQNPLHLKCFWNVVRNFNSFYILMFFNSNIISV